MLPLVVSLVSVSCLLGPPADGPVVRRFAPDGLFGGHWGIDVGVAEGTPVRAAASGVVTFSGTVAGNQTITVHHGGGVRTSYSYLTLRRVAAGERVAAGAILGASGVDHGIPAVHFSVRVGDRYVDPLATCRGLGSPSAGLHLAPTIATYPVPRAPRPARRDL
ncbi:MAG: M23 family metallopeptidase [Actinomycetota bacterium]